MNLKDFIETSLVDIIEGVKAAQKKTTEKEIVLVHPPMKSHSQAKDESFYLTNANQIARLVKFDVALTSSKESNKDKGGELKVVSIFSLKKSQEDKFLDSGVSRITFEIPISLPGTTRGVWVDEPIPR